MLLKNISILFVFQLIVSITSFDELYTFHLHSFTPNYELLQEFANLRILNNSSPLLISSEEKVDKFQVPFFTPWLQTLPDSNSTASLSLKSGWRRGCIVFYVKTYELEFPVQIINFITNSGFSEFESGIFITPVKHLSYSITRARRLTTWFQHAMIVIMVQSNRNSDFIGFQVLCAICSESQNSKSFKNVKNPSISDIMKSVFARPNEALLTTYNSDFKGIDSFDSAWTHRFSGVRWKTQLGILSEKLDLVFRKNETLPGQPGLFLVVTWGMGNFLNYVNQLSWTGSVKYVLIDQADYHFAYCMPLEILKYSETEIMFILNPFKWEVWITIALIVGMIGIIYRSVERPCQIIGTLLNQSLSSSGEKWMPVLVVVTYFAALVLCNMYTAELTGDTTAPRKPVGIQTNKDLVGRGYTLLTHNSYGQINTFNLRRHGLMDNNNGTKISSELTECSKHNISTSNECVVKLRVAYLESSLHVWKQVADMKRYSRLAGFKKHCDWIPVPWSSLVFPVVFRYHLSLKAYRIMLRAEESGIFWKFENSYRDAGTRAFSKSAGRIITDQDKTKGDVFIALFKLCGMLLGLSIIVLIIEFLLMRSIGSRRVKVFV